MKGRTLEDGQNIGIGRNQNGAGRSSYVSLLGTVMSGGTMRLCYTLALLLL